MSKSKPAFELTHPNAAGIDIGASSHFVAVPPDRGGQPVREFPSFTVGLERLARRMRGGHGGNGIHRRLLDTPVRASRVALKIIRAILGGERDGQALAKLKDGHLRASEADIAKSLQGNWREEHLFALKQAVALYDAYGQQVAECDR